ncbi:MAG: flagellar hook-basal body complex protein FliE [Spirochaetaceae bacterium]|jgi:flagellar hook-basal body complex protein FliE|nr:flagellar hook-basal body complex protein FliE [Spirochaetaceae bacterium]
MLSITPQLQQLNPLSMTVKDARHIASAGVVGFQGSFDHGGAMTDLTAKKGQGAVISELGTNIGAEAILRSGSLGAAGLNRSDPASFADAMLHAIDQVSAAGNRASDLTQEAIINPEAVDIHDITIAQAEASMSLNIATTLLNRVTQAWKDLTNLR